MTESFVFHPAPVGSSLCRHWVYNGVYSRGLDVTLPLSINNQEVIYGR